MEKEDEESQCNTKKDQHHPPYRTAGVCAGVFNCGIVAFIDEIFGSESLSQVVNIMYEYFKNVGGTMVCNNNLAYDDACHLKRYINRRSDNVELEELFNLNMVVDKLHFKNHTDKWCKKNVNPYKNASFDELNTMVCEQAFSWLAKYKHSLSNMSCNRFDLVIYSICHYRNSVK